MEIDKATRTVLEKSPGLDSKKLLAKVIKLTGKSRSAIFHHWSSLESRGRLYRYKGQYWNEKPTKENTGFLRGAADFLENRSKRKRLEKKEKEKELSLEIRRRQCKIEIRRMEREYYSTQPQKNRSTRIPFDVQVEIEKKCRKKCGLSAKEPL